MRRTWISTRRTGDRGTAAAPKLGRRRARASRRPPSRLSRALRSRSMRRVATALAWLAVCTIATGAPSTRSAAARRFSVGGADIRVELDGGGVQRRLRGAPRAGSSARPVSSPRTTDTSPRAPARIQVVPQRGDGSEWWHDLRLRRRRSFASKWGAMSATRNCATTGCWCTRWCTSRCLTSARSTRWLSEGPRDLRQKASRVCRPAIAAKRTSGRKSCA